MKKIKTWQDVASSIGSLQKQIAEMKAEIKALKEAKVIPAKGNVVEVCGRENKIAKPRFKVGEKARLMPSMFQHWMGRFGYKPNGIYKVKAVEDDGYLLVFEKIPEGGGAWASKFEKYPKRKNRK